MEHLLPYIVPIVIVAIVVVLLVLGYVKAPPDMAYIISGMKKKSKVVIGKASIRIPFFGNRQIIMRSDIKLPQPFASWSNSL